MVLIIAVVRCSLMPTVGSTVPTFFHAISHVFPYLNAGGASRALQAALAEIQAAVQQSLERTLRTKTTWSSTKTRATGRSSENEEWDGCWIYICWRWGMITIAVML